MIFAPMKYKPPRLNALVTFSKSPVLENFTSQILTSEVKPEVATNLPQGETWQQYVRL